MIAAATDRRLAAIPLAGAVLCLFWLAAPLPRGGVYTEDDLGAFHLPLRAAYQDALRHGDNVLWNPHLFNGFHVHGEGQIGMFHPLHWAAHRFLPLPAAFMITLLASYPFAFAGMWILLRRWRLPAAAAAHGAFLFTFLGFSMNHYVHVHFVLAFAHLPWGLWCVDAAMRGETPRLRWAGRIGLPLLGASQLLLGAPQPTWFAWLIEGAFAVGLLWRTRRVGAFAALGALKCVAFLIAGVQTLPMLAMVADSYRAAPDAEFRLFISLRPWNLLQWVQPYLFEGRVYATRLKDEPWDAPYLGAATPALICFAAAALRGRGPMLWAAIGLIAFGLLAALGGYGFLHPLLDAIPVVNKLRAPARHVAIAHFGMALGAALGVALLARGEPWPKGAARAALLPAAAACAIAAGVAALRALDWPATRDALALDVMPTATVFFGALLVAAASLLVWRAAHGGRHALSALLCLTLIDAGLYSMRHKHAETLDEVLARIDAPPAAPGAAFDPDIHPSTMNLPMMIGHRMPFGYVALSPARRLDHTLEEPLRLAGVAWRRARVADPALREAALRGETWVPLEDPMPRAWLVAEARATDDPARDLPAIDPRRAALVDAPAELDPGPPGRADVLLDRPGRFTVRTETPGRQLLVTGMSWHAGWRVVPPPAAAASVIRVNGDFLGVLVGPGEHVVALEFRPAEFTNGLRLTALGLAALLGLVALAIADFRRPAPPAP